MPDDILSGVINNQPVDSTAEAAQKIANQIIATAPNVVRNLINQRNQLYESFWKNPSVPPHLISAAMGTKAASIFKRDAKLAAYLAGELIDAGNPADKVAAILPGMPDAWTATFNADGSVTITPAQAAPAPKPA